jgi:hypothetical protein
MKNLITSAVLILGSFASCVAQDQPTKWESVAPTTTVVYDRPVPTLNKGCGNSLASYLNCGASVAPSPDAKKFDTLFLVLAVNSYVGQRECGLSLVSQDTVYNVTVNRDYGYCDHLPTLHSVVWGYVHHSKFREFLVNANHADVPTELLDLVTGSNGKKIYTQKYYISSASAVDKNFGK